ncbi:peroxisomal biogenesis factor 11 [Auriculariales sp. MPI-PUGE-AT-0066]|nr:peroxisomal biogenesis factor 11 [Auriculariales sp. MPI-PUGE-AT-0066]
MSKKSQGVTLAKANDAVLGAFGRARRSEDLDHVVRYLSTWSGSDKLLMILQYGLKVLVPLIELRARVQHRAGVRVDTLQDGKAISSLRTLSSGISDARMLGRIWGLLPIIQWMISMEKSQPATRNLLIIERLQGWSMLAYYPLEHIYYLASHKMIPWKISRRTLDTIGLWSTRFWAAYVLLQFLHLREDWKLVRLNERALKAQEKGKATDLPVTDGHAPVVDGWRELAKRKRAMAYDAVVNTAYLPLTIHWSLERGFLPNNEGIIGALGLAAGLASFRAGWEATK